MTEIKYDSAEYWKKKYHQMGRFAVISSLFCLVASSYVTKYIENKDDRTAADRHSTIQAIPDKESTPKLVLKP